MVAGQDDRSRRSHIETKPPKVLEATPAPEETLQPLDTEPLDIGEDYDAEVPDVAQNIPIYQRIPIDENIINVLLVGVDAHPGETGSRSDTTMLVSYNRQEGTIQLVSFMRDIWTRIPDHGWNRINAAQAFGGVGLTINTINENYDLDIQRYITIRFEQFTSIVDELGGVKVTLTKKEIDYINNALPGEQSLDDTPGVKLLNGKQALVHCRNRKTGGGDFERTRRQREFMLAVFQKVKQKKSVTALTSLLTFVLNSVETNMKPDELFTLGMEVVTGDPTLSAGRIPFDNTWQYASKDGRSVITIDLEKNKKMLHELLYGQEKQTQTSVYTPAQDGEILCAFYARRAQKSRQMRRQRQPAKCAGKEETGIVRKSGCLARAARLVS